MVRLPGRARNEIMHISHNHPLHLVSFTQSERPDIITRCCGPLDNTTRDKSTHPLYKCASCSFFIHKSCSELPPLITHPGHRAHNLALRPISLYTDGSFVCDACGKDSVSFLYSCADCCFDIHTHCASMPLTIRHHSHGHPLTLTFSCLYTDGRFGCDVCGDIGARNVWLYRCDACGFDAHLGCVRRDAHPHFDRRGAGAAPPAPAPAPVRPRPHFRPMGFAPDQSASPGPVFHEWRAGPVRPAMPRRSGPGNHVDNDPVWPPGMTRAQWANRVP